MARRSNLDSCVVTNSLSTCIRPRSGNLWNSLHSEADFQGLSCAAINFSMLVRFCNFVSCRTPRFCQHNLGTQSQSGDPMKQNLITFGIMMCHFLKLIQYNCILSDFPLASILFPSWFLQILTPLVDFIVRGSKTVKKTVCRPSLVSFPPGKSRACMMECVVEESPTKQGTLSIQMEFQHCPATKTQP